MSDRKLRGLSLTLTAAAALLVGTVTPAWACHEATGWCCVSLGCCYWKDNQIQRESCFLFHDAIAAPAEEAAAN